MNNKVCVILVTRNRLNYLKNVVSKLTSQTNNILKCIIVDNDSSDDTESFLKKIDPELFDVLFLKENIGHGAGLARAMEYALLNYSFEYFLFLEDDCVIENDLVDELVGKIVENNDYAGICSEGRRYRLGKSLPVVADNEIKQVDFGVFDAFILKSDVVEKIGRPKENYFMMCDDLEYCKRINGSGYKIGIIKILNHRTIHAGSEHFSHSTLWKGYYQSRNRIHVLREHHQLKDFIDCVIWQIKYLYSALLAPDRSKRFFYRLMGIWHGIIGVSGKSLDPGTLSFIKKK